MRHGEESREGDLLARVRRLFLVLVLMVSVLWLLNLPASDASDAARWQAAGAIAAMAAWAVVRSRSRSHGGPGDLVPLGALVVLAGAMGDESWAFAPAYVLLYFRALFGSPAWVAANALGFFLAYEAATYVAGGSEAISPIGTVTDLVGFAFTAGIMHGLSRILTRHELASTRERILTGVSSELLRARCPEEVQRAAVAGVHELVGGEDALVVFWPGDDRTLRLGPVAGEPDTPLPAELDLSRLEDEVLARYRAGRPFITDAATTRTLEELFGLALGLTELVVVPVSDGEALGGAIVAGCRHAADTSLLDVLHRFANEVGTSLDRGRLIEELVRANGELRRADELKNEFLSNVSHELRTPLTVVSGGARTLVTHWERLDDARRLHLLGRIVAHADRQLALVDDLLLTGRSLSGRVEAEPRRVPVGALVLEVAEALGLAERMAVTVPDALTAWVDPGHLERIVGNLLANASKYGAPPYHVSGAVVGDRLELRVRDHGPGVDPTFVPALFERFRQADGGDRRTSQGVGLGLAIVADLVAANGGSVAYEPRDDGACFVVGLPVGPAEEPARSRPSSVPAVAD